MAIIPKWAFLGVLWHDRLPGLFMIRCLRSISCGITDTYEKAPFSILHKFDSFWSNADRGQQHRTVGEPDGVLLSSRAGKGRRPVMVFYRQTRTTGWGVARRI